MRLQFNYNGQFRIVADDGTEGAWANYTHLAVLEHDGKTYIAASQYGLLPKAETIFELGAVPTTQDHSMEHIDARGVSHRP